MVGSPASEACDRHLFDPARELGQQGAFGRQRTDVQGVEACPVHQHRHFHACAFRQVGDQLGVGHVAIKLERLAALQRIDDVGGVLVPALQSDPDRLAAWQLDLTWSFQVASVCWYSFRI